MKCNPYMKIKRKAVEVLWLITATTFPDATQQDSMLLHSTKFKLSAQGWPLNFSCNLFESLDIYLRVPQASVSNQYFQMKREDQNILFCPGKVCIRQQEFRGQLKKETAFIKLQKHKPLLEKATASFRCVITDYAVSRP